MKAKTKVGKKTDVYILTCKDASHLGGPMGTEYTAHIFSKPFSTVQKAKLFAEKWAKKNGFWADWSEWKKEYGVMFVDCGAYIFDIGKQKIS